MNTNLSVQRDERTFAVENLSYRWAYFFLTCALPIDILYRNIVYRESAWDLLALYIAGGAVSIIYQARQKILTYGWTKQTLLIACSWGIIGAIVGVVLAVTKSM